MVSPVFFHCSFSVLLSALFAFAHVGIAVGKTLAVHSRNPSRARRCRRRSVMSLARAFAVARRVQLPVQQVARTAAAQPKQTSDNTHNTRTANAQTHQR